MANPSVAWPFSFTFHAKVKKDLKPGIKIYSSPTVIQALQSDQNCTEIQVFHIVCSSVLLDSKLIYT